MKFVGFIFSFLLPVVLQAGPFNNFIEAIANGNTDQVISVIESGEIDVERYPDLMHLALDQPKVLEVFLSRGMDPEARHSRTGNTLLFSAVERGLTESVYLLLKYDADPNSRNNHLRAQTPFLLAASKIGMGRENRYMFISMFNKNADLKSKTTYTRDTVLHLIVTRGVVPIDVEMLIQKGAVVNALNSSKQTPVDRALKQGLGEIVIPLRTHGGMESHKLPELPVPLKCWPSFPHP